MVLINTDRYSYHSRHGDLKPENILILRSKTESPYVCCWKISDFGISSLEKKKVLKGMNNF
jgi:serine/threonine protein kinase